MDDHRRAEAIRGATAAALGAVLGLVLLALSRRRTR
jgi:hypothetical protein